MSLISLAGETFSPDNFAQNTFAPTFEGPVLQITADDAIPAIFSNADLQGTDSYMVASVDLTDATSYRLGTAVLNDVGVDGVFGTVDVDIIGTNDGQVLLGVQPYDPTQADGSYYPGYILLSNSNIDNPTLPLNYVFADVYQPPCFVSGTLISTPAGYAVVESLVQGDVVRTVSGESRSVTWVGHRRVDVNRHPHPEQVRPVRVSAGAIADRQPARDLFVSPDHNLLIDGVLFPAKCLINGTTIVQVEVDHVTYHHVELETHDVIFAEGQPAETYLDTGNRSSFAGNGVTVAHPDFASAPDVNYFAWEAGGCARLVVAGPELDHVRAAIAARIASADHRPVAVAA